VSPNRRDRDLDGDVGDGPEVTFKGRGKARDWIIGGLMLITAIKSWVPAAPTTEDKNNAEKLAPIYQAMEELRLTLGQVNSTLQYHTAELADHEARLRAAGQWSRSDPPPVGENTPQGKR